MEHPPRDERVINEVLTRTSFLGAVSRHHGGSRDRGTDSYIPPPVTLLLLLLPPEEMDGRMDNLELTLSALPH